MKSKKSLLVFPARRMRGAVALVSVMCAVWLLCCPEASAENPGAVMATGMTRGLVNCVTGVGEIPRYIMLDTAEPPYATGPLTGLFKGTLGTCFRVVFGAFDIASFGLIPEKESPYAKFKMAPYIWDEYWTSPEEDDPHMPPENRVWLFW